MLYYIILYNMEVEYCYIKAVLCCSANPRTLASSAPMWQLWRSSVVEAVTRDIGIYIHKLIIYIMKWRQPHTYSIFIYICIYIYIVYIYSFHIYIYIVYKTVLPYPWPPHPPTNIRPFLGIEKYLSLPKRENKMPNMVRESRVVYRGSVTKQSGHYDLMRRVGKVNMHTRQPVLILK